MADWGMKVSKDGVDVKTATGSDLILTAGRNLVKCVQTGTTTVTMAASATTSNTQISLPSALSGLYAVPIAFADIQGRRYRTGFGASAIVDYIGIVAYNTGFTGQTVAFVAARTSSSSTWPGAVTITFRYYLVGI